jgi:hypothetical protein
MKKSAQSYNQEELLAIATDHREQLTSTIKWNTYSKEAGLPHSQTFIKHFGSWNKLKECLSLPELNAHRPVTYSKDTIKQILEDHGQHYTSNRAWDDYVNDKELPIHQTIINHYSIEEIRELVKVPPKGTYTETDLRKAMLTHFPYHSPTIKEWNQLAKNEDLPNAATYMRRFGSWMKAQENIRKRMDK